MYYNLLSDVYALYKLEFKSFKFYAVCYKFLSCFALFRSHVLSFRWSVRLNTQSCFISSIYLFIYFKIFIQDKMLQRNKTLLSMRVLCHKLKLSDIILKVSESKI